MHAVLAIQEIALVCPRSADIVQAGNFGPIRTFVEYATPEQKARFLPDLLGGRKLISLGMTEPQAGSAVTELSTSATREGDEVVINGSKIFSTQSPEAGVFLVYVRSEEHKSELKSLMRISYDVFCMNKTNKKHNKHS